MEKAARRKKLVILGVTGMLVLLMGAAILWSPINDHPQSEFGHLDLSMWDFEQDSNLKLDGEWEFYWKQLITYTDLPSAQPDLYGYVPLTWDNYVIDGNKLPGQGYGTYRLRVNTNLASGEKLGLNLHTFASAYTLYINEVEIASAGRADSDPHQSVAMYRPQTVEFTVPASQFDIIVHVSNFEHARGGLWSSIILGSSEGISSLQMRLETRQVLFMGGLIFLALTYFCLFILRRQSRDYLYLALLALVLMAVIDSTDQFLITRVFPGISYRWLVFILYASTSWVVTLLALFTGELFPSRHSKQVIRVIAGYTGLLTLLYLLAPVSFYTGLFSFLNIGDFVILLFVIYLIVQAALKNAVGSRLYLFGFSIAVFVYFYDTLFATNMINSDIGGLAYVGIAILVFVQTVVQALRYTKSHSDNSLLLDKLQAVTRQKDEFMYNASHQIRSPLTAITSLSKELLGEKRGKLTPDQKQNLALINVLGEKASHLVDDLLDYSILKRGDLSITKEPVNLRTVTDSVLRVLRQKDKGGHISLESDLAVDLPLVWADEDRLYQIIYTLVTNAAAFASQGRVKISALDTGSSVEVAITSSATDISPDELSTLFEAIEDKDGKITEDFNGVGLGLPITRRLIELQGGKIWAVGTVDNGIELMFTIPVAAGREDVTPFSVFPGSVIHSQGHFHVPGTGPHILVIDDNLNTLDAIANILGLSGFAVTAVNDGDLGIQRIIRDKSISVVLLDLMIPGKSGVEFCREIRRDKTSLELPVLLLISKAATRDIVMGFDAGANDYLVKPFEKEELLARVRTLANLKESVDKAVTSEIAFLQAQIKPHFLYNALSVIAALTLSDPDKARELIIDLSEYLRSSFNFSGSDDMVELSQEIELVQAYVAIEMARFGSRLDFQLSAGDFNMTIPRLVLQPLVENAIRHGIFNSPQGGYVHLQVKQGPTGLHFTVSDNGVGMTKDKVDSLFLGNVGQGVGLNNINKRLARYYGSGLMVESNPGQGTTVGFHVPWQANKEQEGGVGS